MIDATTLTWQDFEEWLLIIMHNAGDRWLDVLIEWLDEEFDLHGRLVQISPDHSRVSITHMGCVFTLHHRAGAFRVDRLVIPSPDSLPPF